MNELEKEILNIIEKRYKCKYNGGIKVTKIGQGLEGYKLSLYLGNWDRRPLSITAELNEKDFLKFVEQELISRLLHLVDFFKGVKIYPEDEERRTCK